MVIAIKKLNSKPSGKIPKIFIVSLKGVLRNMA